MANVSIGLARIVVVLLSLAGATNAFAQGGTGTLTGTVVDSTGAAVPGATVTATELNTGTERTVVSDDTGIFRMAALNPGLTSSKSSSPASGRCQSATSTSSLPKFAISASWRWKSAELPSSCR